MCGLIALFDAARPLDARALEAALVALRDRGPDGSGRWLTPERDVALGHTRLAIVDVQGGAQPLSNEDGAVVAALNGELYGAEELRAELCARGHQLRTRCDAELLVHLYEDEGPALVRRLRGEFAFILYDSRRRRLMAARDPDGVRPLYLAAHGSRVMLGSTARALFAAGLPARWDEGVLRQSAALQYPTPGATLFAGVRAVPAGGVVLVDRSGVRVAQASGAGPAARVPGELRAAVPVSSAVKPAATTAHPVALRALRAALDDAVRVRIPREVSFACALSGGLDSSAILALVARQRGVAPPAFTVRFEGDAQCEWALAAQTARALGAPHHEVRLDDAALAEHLPQAARDGEGSAINAHLVGKWALARAVSRAGHKVLLSGEGADEVTFGYAHFLVDAGLHPTEGQQAVLRGSMLGPRASALDGLLSSASAPLGLPHFVHAKLALGARIHALGEFGEQEDNARGALLALDHATRAEGDAPWGAADPRTLGVDMTLLRSRDWWRRSAFERYILATLGDAVELAHGVEGRPPFLDAEVQRACASIAPSAFMRGGVEKQALREALSGLLPDAARLRRKQPFFSSPMLLAARPGRLFDLAHATLTGANAPGFINRAAVADRLERARGADIAERRLWEAPLMWMLTTALLEQELLA